MTGYPPEIETARGLLLEQLGKLLTIEEALARRIAPELEQEVSDDELKSVISEHLEQTRTHVQRVREAFETLGESPSGRPAHGLHGLQTERHSKAQELAPSLRGGFDTAAAMGVEHYEINAYEAAIRLADALRLDDVTALLRTTLGEEVDALGKLAEQADRLAHQAVEEPAVP
jgi:ferritin-like metal-binding protein YciE